MAGVAYVSYYGETLIDLTGDTVTADKLLAGATAHDASGSAVTGAVVTQVYRTGSGAPEDSLGADGDLYFDLG